MDLSKNNCQNVYNNELQNVDYSKTHLNTMEEKTSTPSVQEFSSMEDMSTRKMPANIPIANNKSLLKSCEENLAQEKPDVVSPEKLASFQKDAGDEVETIEKIAEMIAVSTKNAEGNSPKIKKRLKVLMSRTHSINVFNNSDDSTSNTCLGISHTSHINADEDSDENKAKSAIDQPNKKRKTLADSPKSQDHEKLEGPNLKKSPFEEIEDKLQEMFAGIEDEEELTNSTEEKVGIKKCNESSTPSPAKDKECSIESLKVCNSPTPAKTSISSNPVKRSESKDNARPASKTAAFMKSMPPQRRLSIGMRKDFLNLSNEDLYKKKASNYDDKTKEILKPDTQNSLTKQAKKNFNSNKSNKQNKSCKYKKDANVDKTVTSNNKKIIRKCEAFNKSKQNRQKTKEPRSQRLQSSENDTEEKLLQPKDIETKNRSPYILVKSNGSISVVNTIAPDELNEKLARPKKHYNYAHERKNVKGCYSSTLGNRYDADTADSSWKCVFCKLGPHKKRLGDLFGPYVISSDCEEYRSIKNAFEVYQRNEAHTLNIPKLAHKFNNITSNSHTKNIAETKYEDFNSVHTAGMSQVSVNCYEVWVHEDCAIWAPNIFFVGSRLSGLEEASWKSTRYECVNCLKTGALLCCLQRGCKTTSHVPCARECKWLLDESRFWVYCNNHATNSVLKKN